MPEWLLVLLVGLAIVVGIVGTIVPVIPGLVICWGGVVVYGLIRGFGPVGIVVTLIATMLLIVGSYLGFRIPQRDAALAGVTKQEQIFAAGLGAVGFFVVPVVGLPLGFILGVYLARMRATQDPVAAWVSTKAVLRSTLKAGGVQALFGVAIGAVWAVWVVVRGLT